MCVFVCGRYGGGMCVCVGRGGVWAFPYLSVDDGPGPGDFVVASDPIMDDLGRLCEVDLSGQSWDWG